MKTYLITDGAINDESYGVMGIWCGPDISKKSIYEALRQGQCAYREAVAQWDKTKLNLGFTHLIGASEDHRKKWDKWLAANPIPYEYDYIKSALNAIGFTPLAYEEINLESIAQN
jgi:hypothetical protein